MAEKEIKVMNFINNPKPFDAYKEADIEAIEKSLEYDKLTPMERRKLEKIYENCMFLQAHSFDEKTRFLEENTRKKLRQRKLEEMKKEKQKKLHIQKLVVKTGLIVLLGAGGLTGYKIYHDTHIKPIKMINENYDKIYSPILVENGQTLTSIAKKLYESYPDDVKKVRTLDDIIEEIVSINHITDQDKITVGQTLVIPSKYVDAEDEIDAIKSMQ